MGRISEKKDVRKHEEKEINKVGNIIGTYRANQKGFGFVTAEEGQKDIYIAQEHTNGAFGTDPPGAAGQESRGEDRARDRAGIYESRRLVQKEEARRIRLCAPG